MSWADDNGITCWDPEDYELYYDYVNWLKRNRQEALDCIDDIKIDDTLEF